MGEGAVGEVRSGRPHFHHRILALEGSVLAIGYEVRLSIAEATDAWLRRDSQAGGRVDARTGSWSARARTAELAAYELIATQQPMAVDLRRLVNLVRRAESVSRSGDLVAHIARSARFERNPTDFSPRVRAVVVEMAAVATALFGDALGAYRTGDAAAGQMVEKADRELDLLSAELFATLLEGGVEASPAIDLALLARFFERIGDHAVDIARQGNFVSGGEPAGLEAE